MKIPVIIILVAALSCQSRNTPPTTTFHATIYLKDFDSSQLYHDLEYLKSLPYVLETRFVSSEQVRIGYLEAGHEESALTKDMLRAEYQLKIDYDKCGGGGFFNEIRDSIRNYDGCNYPVLIYKGRDNNL